MRIEELFRRDIRRTIEEVVKVDDGDEATIANELEEYVATEHILKEFETVLEAYQESILSPNETCTVWVSGFFGSGKSSWAKILGYLLADPPVGDESATERFFGRRHALPVQALLNTIHSRSPTLTVFVNLATGANVVAGEGESVVLPIYRALLERLDYSRNFTLAELEYTLEGDGKLAEFEEAFAEINGRPWRERRYTALAKRQAARALDAVYGSSGGLPDWAQGLEAPDIDADWLAARALELLERRGDGCRRLAFVVDEAGQYVARSVHRMLDLQGLAEAFQKRRGHLWLVVTSQERLDDVVDSLEAKQVELARAQARFPLRVDLLPSDIDEVTGKRVLEKTAGGSEAVRAVIEPNRNKLVSNVRLTSPIRSGEPSLDQLVRLHPLLPYQIQLLIDAVSVRRTKGGASPTVGGSNRTLIKHAQQLVVHPEHGLGDCEIGTLVTMDRSYSLLEELIPTSWQAEVRQVAARYGTGSVEAQVMKVVALCVEVRALSLTALNIAVLLHPHVEAESRRAEVESALARLVADDRLREGEGGYKLQSPEEKDWEQARRGIDLTQGSSVRLRRRLLQEALSGLTVARGRSFKVDVTVEGEGVVARDLALHIEEATAERRAELRADSREKAGENIVTWVYELADDTWDELLELHRSRSMIERRDTAGKNTTEVELLGTERGREARHESAALTRLARDLAAGQVIFRGRIDEADGGDLRPTAQRLLDERLDDMYPRLGEFTASLRRDDVMYVLRTADLGTLPEGLREDGIGLVEATPDGWVLVTSRSPLAELVGEVQRRASYGHEATGGYLASHFAGPPFGAPIEVVQALCAAAVRAGIVEVIHQGQRMSDADDRRLDGVFGTIPAFKAATFANPTNTDIPLEQRTDLARKLEASGANVAGHSTAALAETARRTFALHREPTVRVASTLAGIGVTVPEPVTRTREILDRLSTEDDAEVLTTALATWADLSTGLEAVTTLDGVLAKHADGLRVARREANRSVDAFPEAVRHKHFELKDLLSDSDLAAHATTAVAVAERLARAREDASRAAAGRLNAVLEEIRSRIRSEFSDLDASTLAEVLGQFDRLVPPDLLGELGASELEARVDSARARAGKARRQLEDVRTAGRVSWITTGDIVSGPISTEDEVEPALDRIREVVAGELADGKQVRFQ